MLTKSKLRASVKASEDTLPLSDVPLVKMTFTEFAKETGSYAIDLNHYISNVHDTNKRRTFEKINIEVVMMNERSSEIYWDFSKYSLYKNLFVLEIIQGPARFYFLLNA